MELFRELLLMDFMWNFRIQWKASFILRHCQMIIMNSMRKTMKLRGELTKKVYHLGQKVTVRVADADALKRTVDFSVVENTVGEMSLNE